MKKKLFANIVGLLLSGASNAEEIYLPIMDPSPWRLQTYTSASSDVIAVFFTGSPCIYGQLSLPTTNPAEKNRFWNTILAAKVAKKKVFVSFERTPAAPAAATSCVITSYAVTEE